MKNFFNELLKRLFCKTSLVFVLGAVCSAMGFTLAPETAEKIVCLITNLSGC